MYTDVGRGGRKYTTDLEEPRPTSRNDASSSIAGAAPSRSACQHVALISQPPQPPPPTAASGVLLDGERRLNTTITP